MSKKKSRKIEKETRKLIDGITDLVKKKGDGYKFKSKKKKQIKKVKRTCVHWIIRKGKEMPTLVPDTNPANWKCTICGATFPVRPGTPEEYKQLAEQFLAQINQLQFWSVKMGGDSEDTKLFLRLKDMVPRYVKIAKNILKAVNKRQEWEDRKSKSDSLSQFDGYGGFNYRG